MIALTLLWLRVANLIANPICALLALAFLTAWFLLSFFTNGGTLFHDGHFDPGMTVGGYLSNSLQTFILFVSATASVTALSHARKAHHHARKTHEHVTRTVTRPRQEKPR